MNEQSRADSFLKTSAMHVLRLVILPLLLLAIIETAAGFFSPYPTSLFIKDKHVDGTDVYRVNYQTGYRFFPGRLARKPLPEFFPANKPKDRLRIFVLGESAARGESLADFSFARMLEAALNHGSTKQKAEVINTGIPAINSWVIREFAKEIVRYDPDLIIIYAGHNEFIGPFGPSGFSAFEGSRKAALAGIWASSLNLTRLFRTDKLPNSLQQGWKGLEMFYRNKILPGSAVIEKCRLNWQQNMADIFALAKFRNIPVVWCPVPVNIKDCPPFLSDDSSLSDQDKIVLNSLIADSDESGPERMAQLKALHEKFPQHALVNYLLGQAFLSTGNFTEARASLKKALENDCFIVRSTPALNNMATQVAKENGAIISDISEAFELASDNRLTGRNLVYDHVHLTESGHYIAARTIWNSIQASDLAVKSSFSGTFPDFSAIKKLTAYTPSDEAGNLQRIVQSMSHPPFSFQFGAEERIKNFKTALELIKSQINPANDIEISKEALEQQPYNAAISHRIALMYGHGNHSAQEYFNHSNTNNPFNIDTWNNTGLHLMMQGNFDQAEAAIKKALSLAPDFARAHFNLANLYNDQKKREKAIYHFNEAVKSDPSMASAWRNLANIYFREKNFSQALMIYKNAAEVLPGDLLSQIGISNCLLELNDHDAAINHLTGICASFASPLPLFSLGLAREKKLQFNEAAEAYRLASAYDHEQSLQRTVDLYLNDKIRLGAEEFTNITEKLCKIKDFKDPWIMQVYASALLNQGNKSEALAILYRAEKLALNQADMRLASEISANIRSIEQP